MKVCQNCKSPVKEEMLFCNKCGTKWVDIEALERAKVEALRLKLETENKRKAEIRAFEEAKIEAKLAMKKEKERIQEEKRVQNAESRALRNNSGRIVLRIILLVYLGIIIMILIGDYFENPAFSVSFYDMLIYKISERIPLFIGFFVPGIILLFDKLRDNIPFFNQRKLLPTILGWTALIVISAILQFGINELHSSKYKIENIKHLTNLNTVVNSTESKINETELAMEAVTESVTEPVTNSPTEVSTESPTEISTENLIVDDIRVLMETTSLTQAEAEKAFVIMNKVGIMDVAKCESRLGEGVDTLKAFMIFTGEYPNEGIIFTVEKRETYYIGVEGNDLFDLSKGGLLNNLTYYYDDGVWGE